MPNKEKDYDISLRLGKTVQNRSLKPDEVFKSRDVIICNEAREGTTLFLGMAGSGKSQYILPVIFKQDVARKDYGMTVIVNQKDTAYTLYAMAKEAKRKVILLKPSTNYAVFNPLLNQSEWNYDYINRNIINYKQAIKDKAIVIIDMEYDFYRNDAVRATTLLLLQLQTDMCMTKETHKNRHLVYIDDCQHYLPFIGMMIECGNSYNVSCSLFFQGRNQFIANGKDYTGFIDNNVKNTFLMNNINYEDAKYYSEKLCPAGIEYKDNLFTFMHMPFGRFVYDLQTENYQRAAGLGQLLGINKEDDERIKKSAIKFRKKLTKQKDVEINSQLLQPEIQALYDEYQSRLKKSKLKAQENPESSPESTKQSADETPVSTLENIKEVTEEKPETTHEESKAKEPENEIDVLSQLNTLKIEEDAEEESKDIFLGDDIEDDRDDMDKMLDQIDEQPLIDNNILGMEDLISDKEIDNDDSFELEGTIEISPRKKVGSGNIHVLFPNIKSLQRQYNAEIKRIDD